MTQKQQRLQKKKQDKYNLIFNTQTIWKFQLKTQVQGL